MDNADPFFVSNLFWKGEIDVHDGLLVADNLDVFFDDFLAVKREGDFIFARQKDAVVSPKVLSLW